MTGTEVEDIVARYDLEDVGCKNGGGIHRGMSKEAIGSFLGRGYGCATQFVFLLASEAHEVVGLNVACSGRESYTFEGVWAADNAMEVFEWCVAVVEGGMAMFAFECWKKSRVPALSITSGKAALEGALGRRLQVFYSGHIRSEDLLVVLEDVAAIAASE